MRTSLSLVLALVAAVSLGCSPSNSDHSGSSLRPVYSVANLAPGMTAHVAGHDQQGASAPIADEVDVPRNQLGAQNTDGDNVEQNVEDTSGQNDQQGSDSQSENDSADGTIKSVDETNGTLTITNASGVDKTYHINKATTVVRAQ